MLVERLLLLIDNEDTVLKGRFLYEDIRGADGTLALANRVLFGESASVTSSMRGFVTVAFADWTPRFLRLGRVESFIRCMMPTAMR